MKKTFQLLFLASALMLTGNVLAQVQLRYNLEVGKTYGFNQSSEQLITQNIQGMTQEITNTIGGLTTFKITAKEGDVYAADMVFESMIFKMESAMFNMIYDSADPDQEENALKGPFDAVVGSVFKVKFNSRGEILDVKGFDALAEKISANQSDEMAIAAMKETLKGQFGDESIKKNLSNTLMVYPQEKIAVGKGWTVSSSTGAPMPIKSDFAFTLVSADATTIKYTGTATQSTIESEGVKQNGMLQQFSMDGKATFDVSINAQTGWPVSFKQTQDLDGSVSIEAPQMPTPMEIPMSIKSKTELTGK